MQKHHAKTIILFLLSFNFSSAQINFQKTYGGANWEVGISVRQTTDGGYIITGYTNSFGAGDYDVYLIKTNTYGDTIWTRTFGGTSIDQGFSVQQTSDGGYIVTGYTYSFGSGNADVYLIKTDANGDSLWTQTYGGINNDRGLSVQQTSDGGYIIAGYAGSFGAMDYAHYLIKTDSNGNTLWSKTFAPPGGFFDSRSYSVQQTSDGGYIITGYTDGNGANTYDLTLIKTDANGDSLWTKAFGGVSWDTGYSVEQTSDGGYIIAGLTENFGAVGDDVYLIKTDSNGNLVWSKTFGGINNDQGNEVHQTTDGGYIIAGGLNSGYVGLIKTNSNGDSLWTKIYGTTNSWGNSIQQTSDGGYIIVGWTLDFGIGNIYLIKTDSLGNSGCNTGNPAISVTSPTTPISNITTIVASPVTTETTPATIMTSGGSIATTLCTNVGINEIKLNNSFFISPNPNNGIFYISYPLPQNKKGDLQILDVTGKSIYKTHLSPPCTEQLINLNSISEGIYNCIITSGNVRVNKKIAIIKE